MAQTVQWAEVFGKPGLLFHAPRHAPEVLPLASVPAGKDIRAFGAADAFQNGAGRSSHRQVFRFTLLGRLSPQSEDTALKVAIIPLQGQQRTFPHSRHQCQPDERRRILIRFLAQCRQITGKLVIGHDFGFLVVHMQGLNAEPGRVERRAITTLHSKVQHGTQEGYHPLHRAGLAARLENGGLEGVDVGGFQLFRQPVAKTRAQIDVPAAFVPIPALVFGMRGLVRLPDTIERPALSVDHPLNCGDDRKAHVRKSGRL